MLRQLIFTLVLIAALLSARDALNNEAVLKLIKAGLGEDLVVSMIKQQPGTYSTSADDIIARCCSCGGRAGHCRRSCGHAQ